MQLVGRQILYDRKTLGVSAKTIERKRVSHGAIDFVRCAVVRFFSENVRTFCILFEIEAEPGEISCDGRLVGRAFMQALENIVKLSGWIIRTIKLAKRV